MTAEDCPCQGPDDEPGPHIAACPWADPAYVPEGWAAEVGALMSDVLGGVMRDLGLVPESEESEP